MVGNLDNGASANHELHKRFSLQPLMEVIRTGLLLV
ncbi:MAG: hypothetical protein CM15mP58_12070 [Burkholderiaceae bacterium]|nr:MAG: hypothetical protein CM15mP58_12070 [Burkholderiaceae bacterium]